MIMPAKKKSVPPVKKKKKDEAIVAAAPVEPVAPVSPPVPPAPLEPVMPVSPVVPTVSADPYAPPQPVPPTGQKPGMVQAIAVMTLVNGILNILWGLGLTSGVVLGTLGIGLLCAPVTILPLILGIFEILYAVKILPNPIQRVQPNQTIAILEICMVLFGDFISLIVGILALVFYSDANVKGYFARINSQV
jgi:hypothetical protein